MEKPRPEHLPSLIHDTLLNVSLLSEVVITKKTLALGNMNILGEALISETAQTVKMEPQPGKIVTVTSW